MKEKKYVSILLSHMLIRLFSFAPSASGQSKSFNLTLSTFFPAPHRNTVILTKWTKEIEKRTNRTGGSHRSGIEEDAPGCRRCLPLGRQYYSGSSAKSPSPWDNGLLKQGDFKSTYSSNSVYCVLFHRLKMALFPFYPRSYDRFLYQAFSICQRAFSTRQGF